MAIRTLTANLPRVVPTVAMAAQDAVFGTSPAIDLRTAFSSFSGDAATLTYSVYSGALPYGCSISGYEIVGAPCLERPRQTVTIQATDGGSYTARATISLGVTCKAGIPAPILRNNLMDRARAVTVFGLTSDVTVSTNMADLTTALIAAFQDGGTATTPKVHRVNWTGGDLSTGEIAANSFAADPHAWVILNCNGATLRNTRVGAIAENTRFVCQDAVLVGDATVTPCRPTAGLMQFDGCKIGYYFNADPSLIDNSAITMAGDYDFFSFMGCHIAGGANGFTGDDPTMTMVDCLFTHIQADHITLFQSPAPALNYMRIIGNVFALSRQTPSGTHPDVAQIQDATKNLSEWYQNVIIADNATYGNTPWRYSNENGGTLLDNNHIFDKNVVATSGVFVMSMTNTYFGSLRVHDLVAIPCPGIGTIGHGMGLGNNLTKDLADWIIGADLTGLGVAGTAISYDERAAASTEATFPSIVGTQVSLANHTNQSGGQTVYIPNVVQATFHPQSWRNWISTYYVPAAGWGDNDPANYGGVYSWGTVPTFTAPTLTSGSVTGDQLTITASQAGGVLWAFVSNNVNTPNFTMLRHGVEPDGTFETTPQNNVKAYRIPSTSAETYTLPKSATGLHVHICMEATDGSFSTVTTITP